MHFLCHSSKRNTGLLLESDKLFVVNGGVCPYCVFLQNCFSTATETAHREAYKMKGFTVLTGPRREVQHDYSLKFGGDRQGESRAKTEPGQCLHGGSQVDSL